MHESSVRQCGRCCFSRRIAGRLYCIRNPPTTDPATGRARWPRVAPTDRCGVYSPKPQNRESSLVTRDSHDPNDVSSIATPGSDPLDAYRLPLGALPVLVDQFGEYCRIPLTQGCFAKVDPQDYPWLAQFRWCLKVNVDNCYAVRTVQIKGKSKRIYMHRQIMNTPADRVCDHINHDGLDNRRNNCRNCNVAQNNAHRRKRLPGHGSRTTDHAPRATGQEPRATSSQYIGVSRDKRTGKWRAYIRHKGRQRTLGLFTDEREAARTRDQAAIALHGEFAVLNFPDPPGGSGED